MDLSEISLTCADCPKSKKLNTPHPSPWAHLPYLVLTEVFGMLNEEDRRNASGVCRNWRDNYFYPGWFSSVTFPIQSNELEKSRFLANKFGSTVTHANIVLGSSSKCVKEFIHLLQKLSGNNNLMSLIVRPSQCRLELSSSQDGASSNDMAEVTSLLVTVLPRLSTLDISCIKDLSICAKSILDNLNPSLVTSLELAPLLDDPGRYVYDFDGTLSHLTQIRASTDGIFLIGSTSSAQFYILLKSGACYIKFGYGGNCLEFLDI